MIFLPGKCHGPLEYRGRKSSDYHSRLPKTLIHRCRAYAVYRQEDEKEKSKKKQKQKEETSILENLIFLYLNLKLVI